MRHRYLALRPSGDGMNWFNSAGGYVLEMWQDSIHPQYVSLYQNGTWTGVNTTGTADLAWHDYVIDYCGGTFTVTIDGQLRHSIAGCNVASLLAIGHPPGFSSVRGRRRSMTTCASRSSTVLDAEPQLHDADAVRHVGTAEDALPLIAPHAPRPPWRHAAGGLRASRAPDAVRQRRIVSATVAPGTATPRARTARPRRARAPTRHRERSGAR